MEPIAYLTVEVKHRELESRALIAAYMLEAGFPVIVGQQWTIFQNAAALPPGVALFKTVNDIQANNMRGFRGRGHLVAATDEEVLLCMEDVCFMLAFGPRAAENCDLFLAQSEHHRGAIARKFPELAGKIEVVGNPRIDLLAPKGRESFEAEAVALREEHGPFILFNTNYGSINSIWKDIAVVMQIAAKAGAFDPNDQESIDGFRAAVEWEKRNYEEMLPLVQWALQSLPNHKIILRPHPGERPDYWQKVLAAAPNALVIPRSNPHPWILASDLVVHTGCTTGLEAALMGRPSVNLAPSKHPVFDRIVNWANPTFETWKDAAVAIVAFLNGGTGPIVENGKKYEAVLREYFPGYSEGESAKEIADQLVGLLRRHGAMPSIPFKLRFREDFKPFERHEALKDKMTVTQEEFSALFERLRKKNGLRTPVQIAPLDDSLFFLRPAPPAPQV